MKLKMAVLLTAFAMISGCSSSTKQPSPENTPDTVISRIDELTKRPTWVKESTPFILENSKVTSLGQTTIPGDHRVEAGYRVAETNAKAAIAGAIEQRLEFILQSAEEGTSVDTNQVRFIGAEAPKLVTSSIRPGQRYWEKVATTQDSGERTTQYRIFATVEMPEAEFKKAVLAAIKKQQGKPGISKDFAEKVDKQWDRFVDGSD